MLLFLEVIISVFEEFRSLFTLVGVDTCDETIFIVVYFFLIFFRVLRHISFILELLLNSAEFNSSLIGSL
jgi:hypothetical protein